MRPRIPAGTSRVIRSSNLTDSNELPLTVTGWAVHGVARRNTTAGAILSEWSTAPTSGQGVATANLREVTLVVTAAQSATWLCDRVVIQARLTSPTGQVERIVDRIYDVTPDAVPA